MPDDATTATDDTSTDTTTDYTTTTDDTSTDDPAALRAEVEKWKVLSRKHETRARENATAAKERDDLKRSHMSEQEKAVDAARDEGRSEARKEMASLLVEAEVRGAAAGRNIKVDALLEGLDRTRFVTDDGKADTAAITKWLDDLAPKDGRVDLGQGARSDGGGSHSDMNVLMRRAAGRQ